MRIPRSTVVALVAALMVGSSTQAEAIVSPVKILGGPEYQDSPFSNGTFLAWESNSVRHAGHWDAFAKKLGSDHEIKLNQKGTEGIPGSFLPGTDQVVLQQYDRRYVVSDLYLYDLSSRSSKPISGVNTDQWEWQPRISKKFLLFGRFDANRDRLLLYKRDSGFTRKLEDVNYQKREFFPDFVGERYASWSVCGSVSHGNYGFCASYIYDTVNGITTKVPAGGRLAYSSTIDEERRDVYTVRSGVGCGVNVGIWKWHLGGGDPKRIANMPDDVDVFVMSLAPSSSGHLDLYFDRIACKGHADIYRARRVDEIAV